MKQCITLKKLGGFYNVYNDDTYINVTIKLIKMSKLKVDNFISFLL